MADFCQDCSYRMFGEDTGELADLCDDDSYAFVLCETCGYIWVDQSGKRVYPEDAKIVGGGGDGLLES